MDNDDDNQSVSSLSELSEASSYTSKPTAAAKASSSRGRLKRSSSVRTKPSEMTPTPSRTGLRRTASVRGQTSKESDIDEVVKTSLKRSSSVREKIALGKGLDSRTPRQMVRITSKSMLDENKFNRRLSDDKCKSNDDRNRILKSSVNDEETDTLSPLPTKGQGCSRSFLLKDSKDAASPKRRGRPKLSKLKENDSLSNMNSRKSVEVKTLKELIKSCEEDAISEKISKTAEKSTPVRKTKLTRSNTERVKSGQTRPTVRSRRLSLTSGLDRVEEEGEEKRDKRISSVNRKLEELSESLQEDFEKARPKRSTRAKTPR